MANSAKGAGNFLGPLFIVATLVVVALGVTFMLSDEEIPDEATVIAEDDVDARPAGAGTVPEGEADETVEGVTDQLDDVSPAAPGEDSVPPADMAEGGSDGQTEGETDADEQTAGTDGEGVVRDEPEGDADSASGEGDAGGDAAQESDAGDDAETDANGGAEADANGETETDAGSIEGQVSTTASDGEGAPAGRDADTELTPEEGQDIVTDTDDGGAAFVPTPSGPEGRDNETIAD